MPNNGQQLAAENGESNALAPEDPPPVTGAPSDDKPPDPELGELDPRLVDPHDSHKDGFVFPGMDGLPYRGKIPNLKETDRQQPELGRQVFVNIFTLNDAKDMADYQKVCQMVGNNYAEISYEERIYDEEIKSWRILIRWYLIYTHMGSNKAAASMFEG
jgi:hypothetical protein